MADTDGIVICVIADIDRATSTNQCLPFVMLLYSFTTNHANTTLSFSVYAEFVPKRMVELVNVEKASRENVADHLQQAT